MGMIANPHPFGPTTASRGAEPSDTTTDQSSELISPNIDVEHTRALGAPYIGNSLRLGNVSIAATCSSSFIATSRSTSRSSRLKHN